MYIYIYRDRQFLKNSYLAFYVCTLWYLLAVSSCVCLFSSCQIFINNFDFFLFVFHVVVLTFIVVVVVVAVCFGFNQKLLIIKRQQNLLLSQDLSRLLWLVVGPQMPIAQLTIALQTTRQLMIRQHKFRL